MRFHIYRTTEGWTAVAAAPARKVMFHADLTTLLAAIATWTVDCTPTQLSWLSAEFTYLS